MKTMELNYETFEVVIPKKSNIQWYNKILCGSRKDLYDCYKKPSDIKQGIYEFWTDWYYELKSENIVLVEPLSVQGANSNTFSLVGIVNIDFEDYIIHITKCHNRLIKVV